MLKEPPHGWSLSRLKEVAKTATGGTPSRQNKSYYGGEIPWVKSGELNDRTVIETEEFLTPSGISESSAKLFPKGTLLIALYGATAGKTAILGMDAATNQAISAIFPKEGIVDANFLRYFLIYIRPQLLAQRHGGAQPNISQTILRDVELHYPKHTQQQQIALVLNRVQRAVEQREKLISLTIELRKAIVNLLFNSGLQQERRKETQIGLLPQSWEVRQLKDAVEYIDYGLSEAIPKTPPKTGGIKIVSTADLNKDGELLYDQIRYIATTPKIATKLALREGDVLFNWRNSIELIGKTAIFEEQSEPHIFASFILRLRCDEKTTHNHYLKHLLNYSRERGVFVKLARRAVNQANYNKNEISVLRIPLPKYQEQVEIAAEINAINRKLDNLKRERQCLQELFSALLTKFMTGQLTIGNFEL